MNNCIFCKIAKHEIPKDFEYEDEDLIVFQDIHPIKPVHLLVVPKAHIATFSHLQDDVILGKIRLIIQEMVRKHGLEGKGYRIVVNAGGAQEIDHLHFHLTGPYKIA